MTDAVDTAELLDIDVDEFARALALIADDRGLGIQGGETSQAAAAQDATDGGGRALQPARDRGATEALAAQGRYAEAARRLA